MTPTTFPTPNYTKRVENYVIVVGCTKTKKLYPCKASEMYSESDLFKKELAYISANYECGYVILSAKYGIINPDAVIEPYDTRIARAPTTELMNNVRENLLQYNKVIAFCGSDYVKLIRKVLPTICIVEPLKGMGIGKRLQFLSEVNTQ